MTSRIIIDREFKAIIPPLKEEEYKNLEESLRLEGCREPISLWNGIIVDGHNRYEICRRLNIPFVTVQKGFSSRDEAISWICLNQLSRRNISEEAFRYLVGKRYDAEKQIAQQRNANGINQYSVHQQTESSSLSDTDTRNQIQQRTSTKIGRLYNLNHSTVERYGKLSRSLDKIEKKSPGILSVILSGACKISKDNIEAIANMSDQEVHMISTQLHNKVANNKHVTHKESDRAIKRICETEGKDESLKSTPILITGVKNMPVYDPDATINEILLTVPCWKKELDRLINEVDFHDSSLAARQRLVVVLRELQSSVSKLQSKIKRCENGKPTNRKTADVYT